MNAYEANRLENIKRNQALIQQLGLESAHPTLPQTNQSPPKKRRKLSPRAAPLPTRTSSRIAASAAKPAYNEDAVAPSASPARKTRPPQRGASRTALSTASSDVGASSSAASTSTPPASTDVSALRARWSSWTPTAPPPTRDDNGTFHFEGHPEFVPNKSPEEMLREGSFGGTYFRPLYSKALGTTISGDWRELPSSWTQDLDTDKYLVSEVYRPEVNKYGVSAGLPIEAWEASGWVNHAYDVRGWFQWYCRFFLGRRCGDDERQIGRWSKCVGERGRWRRTLLKKYGALGIRSVADEGVDGREEGDGREVSPVVHQTCFHWAWELRQDVLDRFWEGGG